MVESGSGIGEDQEEESGLGKSFHSDCPASRDPDAPSSIGMPIARASCTMLLMLALCWVILCVSRSLAFRFSREWMRSMSSGVSRRRSSMSLLNAPRTGLELPDAPPAARAATRLPRVVDESVERASRRWLSKTGRRCGGRGEAVDESGRGPKRNVAVLVIRDARRVCSVSSPAVAVRGPGRSSAARPSRKEVRRLSGLWGSSWVRRSSIIATASEEVARRRSGSLSDRTMALWSGPMEVSGL